ncbi:DUF1444 family protein [Motilimonas cestriensis]|uniref:DUF1444 family protein n=1 Tax=Motilimonas cestriensis TaxID=2742685 RepID=A0ABS8W479_9GAMM|nr:DUF1444 family protein [Motilimonas cestriensis]MCE2593761.1 DUF1444 family protein [Motilimonas cestriensis]
MIKNILQVIGLSALLLSHVVFAEQMDKASFQRYVFEYVQHKYDQYDFEKPDEVEIIKLGKIELGLQNLYNLYLQSKTTTTELDGMLGEHFDQLLPELTLSDKSELLSWREAKSQVRPQFSPVEYLDRVELAHRKLDEYVIIAFVLDQENTYRYITTEDLKLWNVTLAELSDIALSNLDESSHKIPMQMFLEQEKFIAIQAMDGYDAARILIPEFRAFVIEKLGEPFFAAFPNRDFLIMWSGDNSAGFKAFASDKAQQSFSEQPYSLTPNIFKVTRSAIEVVQ